MDFENKYAEIFHETKNKQTMLIERNMTTLLTHNDVVSILMEQMRKKSYVIIIK